MQLPKKLPVLRNPAPSRGRPCLLTKECEAKLLTAIEEGLPFKEAAMLAGVSYDSLNRWRIKGEAENAPSEFSDFCKSLERAKAVAMQGLVSCVREAGKRDWRAAAFLLERRHREDFAKPQQIEHSGPGGGPVEVTPEIDCEYLQRIRKQEGVVKIVAKLSAILERKHRERLERERLE